MGLFLTVMPRKPGRGQFRQRVRVAPLLISADMSGMFEKCFCLQPTHWFVGHVSCRDHEQHVQPCRGHQPADWFVGHV